MAHCGHSQGATIAAKGQNVKRTEVIKITLTPDEKAEIIAAAKTASLDVSGFVRMMALRGARQ